jgi:hypothetical protein
MLSHRSLVGRAAGLVLCVGCLTALTAGEAESQAAGPATAAGPDVRDTIDGHAARGPLDAAGRRHGAWRIKLPLAYAETGTFAAGQRTGLWRTFDAAGQVRREVPWKGDRREGTERVFGRGGHVIAETVWVAGEAVSASAVPVSCTCCGGVP